MHWKYVNVISSGSVYPFQSGKQTMAFAFYYKVANGSKARKVVSGNSMEELREKATGQTGKLMVLQRQTGMPENRRTF